VDPSPVSAHQSSAAEIKARLEAERTHAAFLIARMPDGNQRIVPLHDEGAAISIGRGATADVCLAGDDRVSRLHAEVAASAGAWMLVDDGLSRNGSFVNEERVTGRRRLSDGDVLRIGATQLVFCQPGAGGDATTYHGSQSQLGPQLTPAQRRVLVALCRPLGGGRQAASPATNPEIAEQLFLSVAAVKTHMRALFAALAVEEDLAQNQKRRRVAERAFHLGLVSEHDL
jgi:hypothetical protein